MFFKMATPLQCGTKIEMRSVIRFLHAEGVRPSEIHRRMSVVYGNTCLSKRQVYEWVNKFKNGVVSVDDACRPGQANRVVTPENIAAVNELVQENRCISTKEVAKILNISVGSAHNIVHERLQFHKVGNPHAPHSQQGWVPKKKKKKAQANKPQPQKMNEIQY